MKLYLSPGACSLADHIALREAGIAFAIERVDLHTHYTETGTDFRTISPKGYVPALVLDDGVLLTENVAVLDWIATQSPELQMPGTWGRTRVLEMLTYITTEIHHAYKPLWHGGDAEQQSAAREKVIRLLQPVADSLGDAYLFGATPSVADFYLFVMLLWASQFDIALPISLVRLRERLMTRASVRDAMIIEGLKVP